MRRHDRRMSLSHPKLPFDTRSSPLPEPDRHSVLQIPQEPSPPTPSQVHPSAGRLWLRRLGVLVFVFLCATIGVMLMILPWRPEWSENHLLMPYPTLRAIVTSGFARGICTGLGVLNVWIGFWEAIQYRED